MTLADDVRGLAMMRRLWRITKDWETRMSKPKGCDHKLMEFGGGVGECVRCSYVEVVGAYRVLDASQDRKAMEDKTRMYLLGEVSYG